MLGPALNCTSLRWIGRSRHSFYVLQRGSKRPRGPMGRFRFPSMATNSDPSQARRCQVHPNHDEPDIYLHPSLQRRLIRSIRERFQQFVMATHSVEIINDADANEIVSISAPFRTGRRIKSDKEYEAVYQHLGSAANADFARISRARRVIFVEGQDGCILRKVAALPGLSRLTDPSTAPIFQLGGFSRWRRAEDAAWAFKQVLDLDVDIACLFDRDYIAPDEEVVAFCDRAKERSLKVWVLEKKEIENYLLVPSALQRAIQRRMSTRDLHLPPPTTEQVGERLLLAANETKGSVLVDRAANALKYARETQSMLDNSTVLRTSNQVVEDCWKDPQQRLSLAPGKEVLRRPRLPHDLPPRPDRRARRRRARLDRRRGRHDSSRRHPRRLRLRARARHARHLGHRPHRRPRGANPRRGAGAQEARRPLRRRHRLARAHRHRRDRRPGRCRPVVDVRDAAHTQHQRSGAAARLRGALALRPRRRHGRHQGRTAHREEQDARVDGARRPAHGRRAAP